MKMKWRHYTSCGNSEVKLLCFSIDVVLICLLKKEKII